MFELYCDGGFSYCKGLCESAEVREFGQTQFVCQDLYLVDHIVVECIQFVRVPRVLVVGQVVCTCHCTKSDTLKNFELRPVCFPYFLSPCGYSVEYNWFNIYFKTDIFVASGSRLFWQKMGYKAARAHRVF